MEIKVSIKENFDEKFEDLFYNFLKGMAIEFHKLLIDNIRTNKFGYSNKPATVRAKDGRNTPGIDTGQLINQIVVEDLKVYIRDGQHSSGISFIELGDIIEYGRKDGNFYGYPFWRRTVEEFKPIFEKKTEKFIKENMFKKVS